MRYELLLCFSEFPASEIFQCFLQVIYYSTQIFKAAGLPGSNAEAATVGVGGVLLVTTVVTTLFMERIGRRMLLLFGLASMCVVTCLLTVFMVLFVSTRRAYRNLGLGEKSNYEKRKNTFRGM